MRAKVENDDVHDAAPVMREGDEDGDVEEAAEDAGVDDDEREDAMATEMRGPEEPTNAMTKHHQLTHNSISSMVRTVRARTYIEGWEESARRDSHSNGLLSHESEATR